MWPTYPIPMLSIFYLTNYSKTIKIVLNLILCLWMHEAKFLILYVFSFFVLVSLNFAPKFPIENNSKLVHVIVWHLKWQGIAWIDHHLVRWSIYFRLGLNWSKLQKGTVDNRQSASPSPCWSISSGLRGIIWYSYIFDMPHWCDNQPHDHCKDSRYLVLNLFIANNSLILVKG